MTLRRNWLVLAMAVGLAPLAVLPATAEDSLVEIKGEVRQVLLLSRVDLLALKRREYSELRTLTQDGKGTQLTIRYQGVPLKELLDLAGLKPGPRDIRRAIFLLTARDGYQASFSWGELYNSAPGDGVIVVLRQGNDELLDTDGWPGLRSMQDIRPGPRHVRWLASIEVQLPSQH